MNKRILLVTSIASLSLGACVEADLTDSELDPMADHDPAAIPDAELDDGFDSGEFEDNELGIARLDRHELEDHVLASDELSGYTTMAAAGPYYPVVRYQTCNGGWPGERNCSTVYNTSRNVRAGSVSIEILTEGESGKSVKAYSAKRIATRKVEYSARVSEGDVFNPGKHTSSFRIKWEEYRGNPGNWNYCSKDAPCGAALGDCDTNAECASGLGCVHNVGHYFGYSSDTDVCLPTS